MITNRITVTTVIVCAVLCMSAFAGVLYCRADSTVSVSEDITLKREEVKQLRRIADALEKIANKK